MDRPDFEGRIEIFNVHLRGKPHEGLDLRELAFVTQQFSGAMIANLINMAAILAARAGREVITQADMFDALDYERLGAPRPIQRCAADCSKVARSRPTVPCPTATQTLGRSRTL